MASLLRRGARCYCQFVFQGKRHCFPLGPVAPDETDHMVNQVDYLLMRQGLLKTPPGIDIVTFLQFDGKPPEETPPPQGAVPLGQLRDRYLEVHAGSLEPTTITGMRLHFRHLTSILGSGFPSRN